LGDGDLDGLAELFAEANALVDSFLLDRPDLGVVVPDFICLWLDLRFAEVVDFFRFGLPPSGFRVRDRGFFRFSFGFLVSPCTAKHSLEAKLNKGAETRTSSLSSDSEPLSALAEELTERSCETSGDPELSSLSE